MRAAEHFERRQRRVLLVALPASLAVHAALVALFLFGSSFTTPKVVKRAQPRAISVRPIDSRRWSKNRGVPVKAVPEEAPAELHPKGQVVDVAPGNERLAKDAKYLAESNNRVERETRAREQVSKYSRATAKTSAHPEQLPSAKGVEARKVEATAPEPQTVSELGKRPSLSELFERSTKGRELAMLEPSDQGGAADGVPAAESGDATEGGGAPNDDLQSLPEGEGTYLNTREWKYAGFFNRVKQSVSAHWNPNDRLRAQSQNIGLRDRVTELSVTLRPDGTLADAFVSQSCGLEALDLEAIQAFERAQPFSNPPAALVEKGFIRFRFGFSVINEGAGFRLPFQTGSPWGR